MKNVMESAFHWPVFKEASATDDEDALAAQFIP